MREINFYKIISGSCPVEEFLDSLSPKQSKKMTWVMSLVEELEKVPEQYFKKLTNTDNIWEIRAQQGSDIFRILGFFSDTRKFTATNGFQKKSQKTPSSEIALAKKRKLEHLKSKREINDE